MTLGSLEASSHVQHTFFPPPSSRCTQCNARQKEDTRNLVVCIDGASDQFGHNNTNVVKLFAKIDLESIHPEQFAYYASGIGTGPKPIPIFGRMQRAIYDKLCITVVQNTEETVKDAYGWLAQMYREGDQIYLFGFSRGAYQVRVLAGMIHEVGLMKEVTTEDQIGKAYDYYEAIRSGKPTVRPSAREFKKMFSWMDLKVHFIGVWDTVSSAGVIRSDVLLSMSSSAEHACHFRHALALDECRVKFMPEYFYEVNSQTCVGKSKYTTISRDVEQASSANDRCQSSQGDGSTDLFENNKSPDIKEVWFAGSHSDVGGKSSPGEFRNAGHVSLLWMRREASANGLVLKPTDLVWLPDDLDSGISDSMTSIWRVVEYLPIKHQVSFSGAGEYAVRLHRPRPRRIIPGQKVHASILYANTYKSKATLGEGFDIPIIHSGLDGMELKNTIWETGMFDDTAAQELVTSLGSLQGVAPIYLDRLLFMLRLKEGKRCVREVADWQAKFMRVITDRHYAPLVRLVAIVAYHEASCDPDLNPKGCLPSPIKLSQDIFLDAEECLMGILASHRYQDGPRMFALLRPLMKHQILRERILSPKILKAVVKFLDTIIQQPIGSFGQAMESLDYLLQCEDTRQVLIENLGARLPNSNVSRLSHIILKVDGSYLLPAALRMVLTLARIPEARDVCSAVKPRIKKLASKHDGPVGRLAVEILLVLDDLNGKGRTIGHGQQTLSYLFGLDAKELNDPQKKLIGELKKAVERGNVRERTAATMTLLQLCETATIRTYLRDIHMQDVFVRQMRRKDGALLAAYALAVCLKYSDMEFIKDNGELPKHIVRMLILDYFDDAVGQVEGFQVFGDLMQHAELRKKIAEGPDIIHVLEAKLGKGKPKEIRTSLICLDIFQSLDPHSPRTSELVDKSLQNLKNGEWNAQKAGVTILYALAQTEHGVAAISPRIHEIVEMLLPAGYLLIQPTQTAPGSRTSLSEEEAQAGSTDTFSTPSHDAPPRQPSWMIGPACALRILAQNETLRGRMRGMIQYGYLKDLFLSGALVDNKDTPVWRVRTPNRANVINMFYKMIMAVDDGPFEQGLMSLEDAMPPHIRHWNHLVTLLRNRSEAVVTVLSALLGVPVLVVLAAVVYTPIYASARVYNFFRRVGSRYRDRRALRSLADEGGTDPATHQGESAEGRHNDEGPPGGQAEENPQVDETMPSQDGGIGKQLSLRRSESMQTQGVEITNTQENGEGKQPILHIFGQ